jgi:hypothetical protein
MRVVMSNSDKSFSALKALKLKHLLVLPPFCTIYIYCIFWTYIQLGWNIFLDSLSGNQSEKSGNLKSVISENKSFYSAVILATIFSWFIFPSSTDWNECSFFNIFTVVQAQLIYNIFFELIVQKVSFTFIK